MPMWCGSIVQDRQTLLTECLYTARPCIQLCVQCGLVPCEGHPPQTETQTDSSTPSLSRLNMWSFPTTALDRRVTRPINANLRLKTASIGFRFPCVREHATQVSFAIHINWAKYCWTSCTGKVVCTDIYWTTMAWYNAPKLSRYVSWLDQCPSDISPLALAL